MEVGLDELLSPWRRNGKLLGGHVLTACAVRECDPVLWLNWSYPEDDSETMRCIECIELLDLISTFDTAAFHRLLSDICENVHNTLVDHPASATWQLGLQIDADEGTNYELLGDLFQWTTREISIKRRRRSTIFADVKKELEARSSRNLPLRPIPVRLVVDAGPEGDSENLSALQQVHGLYESVNTAEVSPSFHLQSCHLEFPAGETTTEYLELVLTLVRQGMNVDRLAIFGELGDVDQHLQAKTLQALFRPHSALDPDLDSCYSGVTQLVIRTHVVRDLQAPLFSALMETTSVRHLTLDTFYGGELDSLDRSSWQWLAVALFSSVSTHSIDTLEISATGLLADHIVIIESVTHHSDPVALLLGSTSQRSPRELTQHVRKLERGTEVWIQSQRPEPADITLESDLTGLAVVEAVSDGWLKVMIPGYGPRVIRHGTELSEADIAREYSHGPRGFQFIGFHHLPATLRVRRSLFSGQLGIIRRVWLCWVLITAFRPLRTTGCGAVYSRARRCES